MKIKYPVIALIGSEEFESEFHKAAKELTLRGYIVLAPNAFEGDIDCYPIGRRVGQLKSMNKQRIDMCDEVLVINSNGYLSTNLSDTVKYEIEYAKTLSKKVNYLYYKCNKNTCEFKDFCDENISPVYLKKVIGNILDDKLEPFDIPICESYINKKQQ